jgi:predicted ester cyclase
MEDAKGLVRRYLASYETGSQDVIACLHPSHVYHPPGGGGPVSREARVADEAFFFTAFSDIRVVVEDLIAEGDRVASRISMHCTHTGDYQGIPPSGRRVVIAYLDIVRLEDGKVIEEWAEFDLLSIFNQIRVDGDTPGR